MSAGSTTTPATIIIWSSGESGLPFDVVARLDASWIGPEVTAFVWRVVTLVLLISIVVCLVTMLVIGRFVLMPVLDLRDGLTAARDDPANADSYALPETQRDELGELVGAVNRLLRPVSRTYREDLAAMAPRERSSSLLPSKHRRSKRR
jgi:nitrate/nitrite-specific signal transduction histidine kinase